MPFRYTQNGRPVRSSDLLEIPFGYVADKGDRWVEGQVGAGASQVWPSADIISASVDGNPLVIV